MCVGACIMNGTGKPVLIVALLNLAGLMVAGGEGSGQFISQPLLLGDMEDMEDLGYDEGSADWDTLNADETSAKVTPDYSFSFSNLDDDDTENLEYYEYSEQYNDVDEYNYRDDSLASIDSVLKIEDSSYTDIEIRLKPEKTEVEEIIFETSQIFIMVGSAFVSFAIVMLTFFLCRRMVAKKQDKKRIPFSVPTERRGLKETSIVKDYEKVPTTTKQFLQQPHMNLHSEKTMLDNPASTPLVSTHTN